MPQPPAAMVRSKKEEGLAKAAAPIRASNMKSRRFMDPACQSPVLSELRTPEFSIKDAPALGVYENSAPLKGQEPGLGRPRFLGVFARCPAAQAQKLTLKKAWPVRGELPWQTEPPLIMPKFASSTLFAPRSQTRRRLRMLANSILISALTRSPK